MTNTTTAHQKMFVNSASTAALKSDLGASVDCGKDPPHPARAIPPRITAAARTPAPTRRALARLVKMRMILVINAW